MEISNPLSGTKTKGYLLSVRSTNPVFLITAAVVVIGIIINIVFAYSAYRGTKTQAAELVQLRKAFDMQSAELKKLATNMQRPAPGQFAAPYRRPSPPVPPARPEARPPASVPLPDKK
jgi:hypothetical protein